MYDARLGWSRFLQVDPVEGGCANDYTYVNDPINQYDLDGQKCPGWLHNSSKFLGGGDYVRAARLWNNGRYRDAGWKVLGDRRRTLRSGRTGRF